MKKFYILGFAILLGVCSCLGLLSSFQSQTSYQSVSADDDFASICVIGEATTEMSPDRACISASIQTLSSNSTEAKNQNFEILNSSIQKLIELGIDKDDIVTDYFSVFPRHDYSCGSELIGYCATTNFSFKVENLENIKLYVDGLTESGVTSIRNINFEISNYDEIYNQTMLSALENAKVKAKEISGLDELQIHAINEEYVYCCSNLYREYSEGMLENDLVGKIQITAKLKVEFALN